MVNYEDKLGEYKSRGYTNFSHENITYRDFDRLVAASGKDLEIKHLLYDSRRNVCREVDNNIEGTFLSMLEELIRFQTNRPPMDRFFGNYI